MPEGELNTDGAGTGGENGANHDATLDRRYAEFARAQDKWESAVQRHGEGSRQAKAAWSNQTKAWQAYQKAGGTSSRGHASGRRDTGRVGGRRASDPRGGYGVSNGMNKGPNSPAVDQ